MLRHRVAIVLIATSITCFVWCICSPNGTCGDKLVENSKRSLLRAGYKNELVYWVSALIDKNAQCRLWAAIIFMEEKSEMSVEHLVRMLSRDDSAEIRKACALALANQGDKRALDPLIAALKDKDCEVRGSAALAIGHIADKGDKRALSALIQTLKGDEYAVKSEEYYVKKDVLRAIIQIGDRSVVPALIVALKSLQKDRADRERDRASDFDEAQTFKAYELFLRLALKTLTGQDFGTDYRKWKQWSDGTKSKSFKK